MSFNQTTRTVRRICQVNQCLKTDIKEVLKSPHQKLSDAFIEDEGSELCKRGFIKQRYSLL